MSTRQTLLCFWVFNVLLVCVLRRGVDVPVKIWISTVFEACAVWFLVCLISVPWTAVGLTFLSEPWCFPCVRLGWWLFLCCLMVLSCGGLIHSLRGSLRMVVFTKTTKCAPHDRSSGAFFLMLSRGRLGSCCSESCPLKDWAKGWFVLFLLPSEAAVSFRWCLEVYLYSLSRGLLASLMFSSYFLGALFLINAGLLWLFPLVFLF